MIETYFSGWDREYDQNLFSGWGREYDRNIL